MEAHTLYDQGSSLGGWQAYNNILGALGSAASLLVDYPNQQRLAGEVTESQRDAIDNAFTGATEYLTRGQNIANQEANAVMGGDVIDWDAIAAAHPGRNVQAYKDAYGAGNPQVAKWVRQNTSWQPGAIQTGRDTQLKNISDWNTDYWNRGGAAAQARTEGASREAALQGDLKQSGMLDTLADARGIVGQIPEYQQQYGRQRETAYKTLDNLEDKYSTTKEDLVRIFDIPGMKATSDQIKSDLMNVRGASEIAGAVAPALQERSQVQQQLAQARASGDAVAVSQLQGRLDQLNSGMIDTAGKISDQKTQEWATVATALETTLTTAKTGLGTNLTSLTTGYGEDTAGILNSITNSLNGETNFINSAIQNAGAIGSQILGVASQAHSQISEMVWQGIIADEQQRATAMVDLPNAVISNSTNQTIAANAAYANRLTNALSMEATFRELGMSMQFAYSPAMASLSGAIGSAMGFAERGFGMVMSNEQFELLQQTTRQNNERAWVGTAGSLFGAGASAVDAFGGLPNLGGLGGGSGGYTTTSGLPTAPGYTTSAAGATQGLPNVPGIGTTGGQYGQ